MVKKEACKAGVTRELALYITQRFFFFLPSKLFPSALIRGQTAGFVGYATAKTSWWRSQFNMTHLGKLFADLGLAQGWEWELNLPKLSFRSPLIFFSIFFFNPIWFELSVGKSPRWRISLGTPSLRPSVQNSLNPKDILYSDFFFFFLINSKKRKRKAKPRHFRQVWHI